MAKKGGGKKGGGGGGKKGGGGGKGKKDAWQPKPVPEEPLMIRKPVGVFLTVQVRGIIWRMMDFTERVPSTMKVFELRSRIENRHGGGVTEFTLYKEQARAHACRERNALHFIFIARGSRDARMPCARRRIRATCSPTPPPSSATSSLPT